MASSSEEILLAYKFEILRHNFGRSDGIVVEAWVEAVSGLEDLDKESCTAIRRPGQNPSQTRRRLVTQLEVRGDHRF